MTHVLTWYRNFLSGITMYRLMQWYLRAIAGLVFMLAAFDLIPFPPIDIAVHIVVIVGLCWAWNQLFARLFKVSPNDESQYITGLILALIFTPLPIVQDAGFLVLLTGIAMASKYLLAIRHRHFLNPAATAAVVSALVLGTTASWWAATPATLPLVVVGGLLIIQKLRRWQLWTSFLASYFVVLGLILVIQGTPLASIGQLMLQVLIQSPLLFFLSVLLPEPLTSPSAYRDLVTFGAIVGALVALLQLFVPQAPYVLEASLLVGNVVTRLWYPNTSALVTVVRQGILNDAIRSFHLAAVPPVRYTAGQYLELTLPHREIDQRGIRRHFTIASSPTEEELMVAVKFPDAGSSFKKKLEKLAPGDHAVISQVGGSFVLPADPTVPLLFVAGGIGITPFRSMLTWLVDTKQRRDVILIYGARSNDEFVFDDVLTAAESIGLTTIKVLSGEPPKGWQGERGRLSAELIARLVPDYRNRHGFVSGPEPMVQALSDQLRAAGLSRTQLHRDFFPGYKE